MADKHDSRIEALEAKLAEMTRRRDEWRKKAEGYDEVRVALREKVGAPWPPNLSRALWAGIAADEKKRADDAEAKLAKAVEALVRIADTPSEMTWGVDSEVREAMNGMEIIAETTIAELTGGKDE